MLHAKTIGNKIAEARKKNQLSQSQLGEQLFISAQAVGKWERGESLPDLIIFHRLAGILGVALSYFTGDSTAEINSTFDHSTKETTPEKLNWNMSKGNWVDADFSFLKGLQQNFSSSNIHRCLFHSSDLSGIILGNNHVKSSEFNSANFIKSTFKDSYFSDNDFSQGNFSQCEFTGSFIGKCNFTHANFTEVLLKKGGLEKSNLEQITWHKTQFVDMHLSDLVFDGELSHVSFENCGFKRVQFQHATLINSFFKGRKLSGIKFIQSKADRITYEFLKNGGADLTGLEKIE